MRSGKRVVFGGILTIKQVSHGYKTNYLSGELSLDHVEELYHAPSICQSPPATQSDERPPGPASSFSLGDGQYRLLFSRRDTVHRR
jgi:hypothetical protein